MKRVAQAIYRYALYSQGRYTLCLVALSVFTLPILKPAQLLGAPLLVTLLGAAMGLILIRPTWQPDFLRAPQGFLQGLGAMMISSVVFLMAMALGFVAVLNMHLDESVSRGIAMLTAVPSLLLTGAMWWSALLLIASPPTRGAPPASRSAPEAPKHNASDLRSLRNSRTR